jgi:transposase InsO family protein
MIPLILAALRDLLRPRHDLIIENLALRQQILVLERAVPRPRLNHADKAFWVALSLCWRHWRRPLRLVKPSTVIAWHRKGWRLYWRWKSRAGKGGRPGIPIATIDLIRRMSHDNPLWGAPRIHGELLMLGIKVSEATVAKYMIKRGKPPSQNWQTFIRNHLPDIVAIDFLTVPTVTFETLYVLIFLSLDRRKVIHFNVTDAPSALWTSLQLIQAFPFDTAPRFIIRDRDSIYGAVVAATIRQIGSKQKVIARRSPWQNGFCERMVGTIKRDCLDHMIILNELHLRRVLKDYFKYYHEVRTHLGLSKDAPIPRAIEPPERGPVRSEPMVRGLHHRYFRKAA